VWTTFNEYQWDLNYGNPDVLAEMLDIILFLANQGVEVLRLDAVAFMWKRLGTDSQNQPEAHDHPASVARPERGSPRRVCSSRPRPSSRRPSSSLSGRGEATNKECELAYHNVFMVLLWSALAEGRAALLTRALQNMPPIPSGAAWITYVRCHDDIGWAIDDRDAAGVGLNGFLHRRFLADWYAGDVAGSWGRGLVFQTSGTAASLAGLAAAKDEEAAQAAMARIFLVHALAYGWGGIPVIWSGDELGTLNDPQWASEAGHEDDNRWAHRPRLDWEVAKDRDDLTTVTGKIFQGLVHLARVRGSLPQLHAGADSRVFGDHIDRGVLATLRRHASGPMLCLYNLTEDWRPFPGMEFEGIGFVNPVNALGDRHPVTIGGDGYIWLAPFSAWWVVDG
jgi:amylosucrase